MNLLKELFVFETNLKISARRRQGRSIFFCLAGLNYGSRGLSRRYRRVLI